MSERERMRARARFISLSFCLYTSSAIRPYIYVMRRCMLLTIENSWNKAHEHIYTKSVISMSQWSIIVFQVKDGFQPVQKNVYDQNERMKNKNNSEFACALAYENFRATMCIIIS